MCKIFEPFVSCIRMLLIYYTSLQILYFSVNFSFSQYKSVLKVSLIFFVGYFDNSNSLLYNHKLFLYIFTHKLVIFRVLKVSLIFFVGYFDNSNSLLYNHKLFLHIFTHKLVIFLLVGEEG